MSQALLFVPMHVLGLALCFAFGPRGRPALACALGFAVGLAAAFLLAFAILLAGIPYGPWTLGTAMAATAVAAAVATLRRGMSRRELVTAGVWTAAFAVLCPAVTHTNVAILTGIDTHRILSLAITIAGDGGLEHRTLVQLDEWGVFQVVAHSMMGLTGSDFLYSLPLVMGLTFIPVFALTLWHALDAVGAAPRHRSLLVGLVTAALFTMSMLDYHMLFLHTNLGAMIYLFVFLVMFWNGEVRRDASWLPIAFLALIAFALHRTETSLAALLFLALTVTQSSLPRRPITMGLALFSASVIAWHELLAHHVHPTAIFLTPARCRIISGLILFSFVWWLASRVPIVQRVNRHLPWIVAAACAFALAAAFATKPGHMMESARNWASNLTTLPLWGQSWYLIIALVAVSLAASPPRFRQAFAIGLPAYLAFVLLLAYFRFPYREGRGDSANRMTIQLVPLIFFYLGVKILGHRERSEDGSAAP